MSNLSMNNLSMDNVLLRKIAILRELFLSGRQSISLTSNRNELFCLPPLAVCPAAEISELETLPAEAVVLTTECLKIHAKQRLLEGIHTNLKINYQLNV